MSEAVKPQRTHRKLGMELCKSGLQVATDQQQNFMLSNPVISNFAILQKGWRKIKETGKLLFLKIYYQRALGSKEKHEIIP